MTPTEDDRDTPTPPLSIEFRPVPGFPRYRVGSDRGVWFDATRPGLPPPWGRPAWRRLRSFPVHGSGRFVRLRHGGRQHVRSAELLRRAAFSPEPALWLGRVGPKPARASASPPGAISPLAVAPVTPPAPPVPAPVEPAPVAIPAPRPGFRPVPDFPGYVIDPDRSVWTSYVQTGRGMALSDPPVWRRKAAIVRGQWRPFVALYREGRQSSRSVEKLYALAFAPVPVPRPGPLSARGMYGEPAVGSAHGRAKLDEGKVAEARRLKREGWTYPELVARYGVGKVTLFYAISGRTWSHVPMAPTADGTEP